MTLTPAGGKKVLVEYVKDGQPYVETVGSDARSVKKRESVANHAGVNVAAFGRAVCDVVLGKSSRVELNTVAALGTVPTAVRVRRQDSPAHTARDYVDIREGLKNATHGEVIEWDSTDSLCCLDVDYHGRAMDDRPTPTWLLNAAARMRPSPDCHWVTHGRGLHAVYAGSHLLTAAEIAACAGLSWLAIDPSATWDLTASTRTPPSEVVYGTQTSDYAAVATFFHGEVDDDAVNQWLAENGYERNAAYSHDMCPVSRSFESHGKPVFTGEFGVTCHKCASLGVVHGSRTPGFFPYGSLAGYAPGVLRRMVDRFTHWEHASLVVGDVMKFTGEKARLAYSAAVKLVHGTDPRVNRVCVAGQNLIRIPGRWATRDALESWTKNLEPMLASLPACQGPDGKAIQAQVSRFTQNHDLTEFGYPPVTPIRGMRVYGEKLPYSDNRVTVVVPSGELASPEREKFRPKYLKHYDVDAAWAVIETRFPRINREYLLLLIAARGIAEGQVGLPPLILTCGPSGAGKSSTVHVAAALVGDVATEVPWQKSVERFRQGYSEGAAKGTFVAVNELFKDAGRARATERQAMDVFLNITPESVSHHMYVGPVPMGRIPVTVVTDITVPQAIRNDMQLARRFIYVRIPNRVDWEGAVRFTSFRHQSEEHAAAADALVSYAIDRWFADRPRTLTEIATDLGFTTLENSPDFDDPTEELRQLYDAVCAAPELVPPHSSRWSGKGWKLIQRDHETPLTELWNSVADDPGEGWGKSRRCEEADWRRTLGVTTETTFESKRHGAVCVVRFKGPGRVDPLVNGELRDV